jgi:hypothetical protein
MTGTIFRRAALSAMLLSATALARCLRSSIAALSTAARCFPSREIPQSIRCV